MASTTTKRDRISRWILLVLVGVVLLIVPARCSLGSRESYASSADTARAEAESLAARTDAAQTAARSDKFAAELESARTAVPTHPDIAGLIDSIATAASGTGVVVSSGTPFQTGETADGATEWGLTLAVEGDAAAIGAFLDAISTMGRLVVVDAVDSQIAATGAANATVEARFFSVEPS